MTTLFYPQRQKFGNKQVEQSLTEYFLYPPKGPGQLWEMVADQCVANQVQLLFNQKVVGLEYDKKTIKKVIVKDLKSNHEYALSCAQVISTMPIKNLLEGLGSKVPMSIYQIATNLEYRDFLIVGILLDELLVHERFGEEIDDNWLYIQDASVQMGRIQLFHNWSPFMLQDSNKYWIGAEYFCQEGDKLWTMTDRELIDFASKELVSLGVIERDKVCDGTVVRMPKAYPSYVGSYQEFEKVKDFLSKIENLFFNRQEWNT